ncbi:hypothetical protein PoB_006276600 [Plakobranchus ocellatus]|uniref:Uncharacterized protein n=1 Tax=Plakobranchus ocellatus TaxID=259542 RepID=A0AAV4CWM0_9GAST|nr:hypothetical protein PoB_006276600 [Plakobranchus ocellatus]
MWGALCCLYPTTPTARAQLPVQCLTILKKLKNKVAFSKPFNFVRDHEILATKFIVGDIPISYSSKSLDGNLSTLEAVGCLYIASPQQGDIRLSGLPSGQGAGAGARTRDRMAASLSTVPPTPLDWRLDPKL